jgi:L-ascorbate metabolism protein UlaG (beta-lactamase superfamily)
MVAIRHVRHATLELQFAETRVLVDPMLGAPGDIDPIPNTPNQRENPLVPLPALALDAVDAVLVTHLHRDHFDAAARERLDPDVPILCQPEDVESIEEDFDDVRPVADDLEFAEVSVTRTPARHGHGELAEQMGPVSGFVLEDSEGRSPSGNRPKAGDSEERLYVAGDTVWYDAVAETLAEFQPDVAVVNAGAAQFTEGEPITMTKEEVVTFAEATDADVVAVHMDAINHCLLSRVELEEHLADVGLEARVAVPRDGASAR